MKAIIVIDLPFRCAECPLHYRKRREIYRCELTHQNVPINNRPTWCPLRPMPEQMSWGHTVDYIEGYNACLDELTQEPYGGYKTTGIESIKPIK